MSRALLLPSLGIALVLLVSATGAAALSAGGIPRGVMKAHKGSYESLGATFSCLFSRHSVPSAFVNDDYCDCPDGTDEPGTSACSHLLLSGGMGPGFMFQCAAADKYDVGTTLRHSRVNDGICDCCDGSDEYASGAACPDTCAADFARHQTEAREREQRRQAGLKAKADMIAEAKTKRAEKEAELAAAKEELPALEASIKAEEAVRDKHEATEKAERDKIKQKSLEEKAAWEEEQARIKAEKDAAAGASDAAPSADPAGDLLPAGLGATCRGWRQTKECKGTGEREPQADRDCLTVIDSGASGFCDCHDDAKQEPVFQAFDCGHRTLRCEDVCKHGSDSDLAFVDGSAGDKKEAAAEPQFKVDDGSSYTLPEANDARNKLAELVSKKADVERRVTDVEEELKKEYGPDSIFLSLVGRCFDKEEGPQYSYSLCPFSEMKQVSRTGAGTTSMGRWKGWAEQTYSLWGAKQDLSKMHFDQGQQCWGGPARSTEVQVVCGPTNALLSVDEPSMCTYKAAFQTPAACE